MALGGSRGCGGAFLLEVCQQIVRWEASYKAKPFPKKFEIWWGPKFYKMSKKTWGGPPRTSKNKINLGWGTFPKNKFGVVGGDLLEKQIWGGGGGGDGRAL